MTDRVPKLKYIDLVLPLDQVSIQTVCDGDYWAMNRRWGTQLRRNVILEVTGE